MMTAKYNGYGMYDLSFGYKTITINEDFISAIQNFHFGDMKPIDISYEELEDKLYESNANTQEERDFASGAMRDVSDKLSKAIRRLDLLCDEIKDKELYDEGLYDTLSSIGDELDAVNEFALDMEYSIKG